MFFPCTKFEKVAVHWHPGGVLRHQTLSVWTVSEKRDDRRKEAQVTPVHKSICLLMTCLFKTKSLLLQSVKIWVELHTHCLAALVKVCVNRFWRIKNWQWKSPLWQTIKATSTELQSIPGNGFNTKKCFLQVEFAFWHCFDDYSRSCLCRGFSSTGGVCIKLCNCFLMPVT